MSKSCRFKRFIAIRFLHFLRAEGQIDPATPFKRVARPGKRAMKRLLLATLLVAAVGTAYYYRDYFFGSTTDQLRLTNRARVAVQRSEEAPPPKVQPIPLTEREP